jgi:hypothetical protein
MKDRRGEERAGTRIDGRPPQFNEIIDKRFATTSFGVEESVRQINPSSRKRHTRLVLQNGIAQLQFALVDSAAWSVAASRDIGDLRFTKYRRCVPYRSI